MHMYLGGDTHAKMRKDRNGRSQTFARTNAEYAKPHGYIQQQCVHRCTGDSLYGDAHVDLYMGARAQMQTHEPCIKQLHDARRENEQRREGCVVEGE